VLNCVGLLYAIALSIVLPAAIAFYAAEDDLAAAFRFGEVFSFVGDNLGTYIVTFLMSWVASFIGGLGSLVCGVGWFLTFPYSYMVIGHLYGQAYVEGRAQLPPLPAEEVDLVVEVDEPDELES
jgi:hypothetical protein